MPPMAGRKLNYRINHKSNTAAKCALAQGDILQCHFLPLSPSKKQSHIAIKGVNFGDKKKRQQSKENWWGCVGQGACAKKKGKWFVWVFGFFKVKFKTSQTLEVWWEQPNLRKPRNCWTSLNLPRVDGFTWQLTLWCRRIAYAMGRKQKVEYNQASSLVLCVTWTCL